MPAIQYYIKSCLMYSYSNFDTVSIAQRKIVISISTRLNILIPFPGSLFAYDLENTEL
jgi:hypothetical protein